MRFARDSLAFSLVVLVTLALFGLIGLMVLLMQFQPGFMGMAHGTELHHRVHDLTFGLLLAPGAVGLLAQLRTPSRNFAGQLMALIPWIALLVAFVFATTWLVFAPAPILGALTLIATILHPGRRDFFRSFSVARVNRIMLALIIIAAVPLLAFAFTNIGLQRRLTNDHAALGHYGFMAAFSLSVVGIGLLASFRSAGWRLTAVVAGVLPALLGLASLVYPDNDSGLSPAWALAAIAWGAAFVMAAAFTGAGTGETEPEPDLEPGRRGPAARTPRSVVLIVTITLALLLLFGLFHLAGGGPGRHMP